MSDDNFTLGDSMQIAHNCSNDVGGLNHALAPSATLKQYGIVTPQQLALLRKDIRTNESIGLPGYDRSINPNALKDVANDWTITDLSDVIFEDSFPVQQPLAMDFDDREARVTRTDKRRNLQPSYSKQEVIQAGAVGVIVGFLIGFLLRRR